MKRLSVVIANHNHAAFVGEAIESALNLDWDDVEVVVVDDGSTDASLDVISKYQDRCKVLATENATQRVAANRGFAMTTGDAVIFLDADDVLPRKLPAAVSKVWSESVSKVQLQAQPVGIDGALLAAPFPAYRRLPTPMQISRWARETSAYPTPPGSANVYARWYLQRIFPLDESIGVAADSGCLAAAPFLGDVVAVGGTFVGYRWHRDQLSDLLAQPRRFRREVVKARERWRMAQRACGVADAEIDERPLYRSRELLQFRVAARRLATREERADPPLRGDGLISLWWSTILAPFRPGWETPVRRLAVMCWCVATLAAPSPLVPALLRLRYARRPRRGSKRQGRSSASSNNGAGRAALPMSPPRT